MRRWRIEYEAEAGFASFDTPALRGFRERVAERLE